MKTKIDVKDFTPLTEKLMESIQSGNKNETKILWDTLLDEWRAEVRRVIEVITEKDPNESKGR